jgi:geranylgeranyl diphosphate synthase type I
LRSGGPVADELAELMAGPPSTEADVARATELIVAAGGIAWASAEAESRMQRAQATLAGLELPPRAAAELVALGRYIVERDR